MISTIWFDTMNYHARPTGFQRIEFRQHCLQSVVNSESRFQNTLIIDTLIISRVLVLYSCATDGKFCQITTNYWHRISTISVVVDVKLQYIDILS